MEKPEQNQTIHCRFIASPLDVRQQTLAFTGKPHLERVMMLEEGAPLQPHEEEEGCMELM